MSNKSKRKRNAMTTTQASAKRLKQIMDVKRIESFKKEAKIK